MWFCTYVSTRMRLYIFLQFNKSTENGKQKIRIERVSEAYTNHIRENWGLKTLVFIQFHSNKQVHDSRPELILQVIQNYIKTRVHPFCLLLNWYTQSTTTATTTKIWKNFLSKWTENVLLSRSAYIHTIAVWFVFYWFTISVERRGKKNNKGIKFLFDRWKEQIKLEDTVADE